jgi:nucleotide-binding universal stress UspA family protein
MGLPMGDMTSYGNLVGPGSVEDYEALVTVEKHETDSYLSVVIEKLKGQGINVTSVREMGHATNVIVDKAASLGVSLIAMTTHGRSGLARALVGSIADEVVRKASCPVLLVRVSDKELKAE